MSKHGLYGPVRSDDDGRVHGVRSTEGVEDSREGQTWCGRAFATGEGPDWADSEALIWCPECRAGSLEVALGKGRSEG